MTFNRPVVFGGPITVKGANEAGAESKTQSVEISGSEIKFRVGDVEAIQLATTVKAGMPG